MALLEDVFEGNLGVGLAIAGAVVLAPTLAPAVGRVIRPVAKTVIKTGLMLYRETLAGAGDVAGDIFAEARAELDEESRGTQQRRTTATAKSS
jgi:ethanolamine transporter EutH